MQVDHQVHFRPDRFAHRFHNLGGVTHRLHAFDRLGARHRHELEGGITHFFDDERGFGKLGRIDPLVHVLHLAAAGVVIDAHLVANPAAQQLIHRHAKVLALDVPERLLDAADRGHSLDADLPEMLPVRHLVQMLDPQRVLTDQQLGQIVDRAGDRAGFPFEGRLAPAVQTGFIGFDLDEDPVPHIGVDDQRLDTGDFHPCLFHEAMYRNGYRTLTALHAMGASPGCQQGLRAMVSLTNQTPKAVARKHSRSGRETPGTHGPAPLRGS